MEGPIAEHAWNELWFRAMQRIVELGLLFLLLAYLTEVFFPGTVNHFLPLKTFTAVFFGVQISFLVLEALPRSHNIR